MLDLSAVEMARRIRAGDVSSRELIAAHLSQIERVNPHLNVAVSVHAEEALAKAAAADEQLAHGQLQGPLHGVPFSVKDSLDVAGVRTTAGTWGRRNAIPATCDATLVRRLKDVGGIPISKTNLPDLLFSFETDNLIFGRANNPYDVTRTPGGSSGGEAGLIAACGSPLGLGSDCLGSVRIPAAFCGITSIKPTSGRLPRTGHVPPAGLWFEPLWQIGPMARRVDDLMLAMQVLTGEDQHDWTSPPMPLYPAKPIRRIGFFLDNGFAPCTPQVRNAVKNCATQFEVEGVIVEEVQPPGVESCFELELALLGADGVESIDAYLKDQGSDRVHPLLSDFTNRMRPFRANPAAFVKRWQQWDDYRSNLKAFFRDYDAVLCPVYTQTALKHGGSMDDENFQGFSYTMAWSVAGYPAATVRCGTDTGMPINIQVVAKPWHDLTALAVCHRIEERSGGWQAAVA